MAQIRAIDRNLLNATTTPPPPLPPYTFLVHFKWCTQIFTNINGRQRNELEKSTHYANACFQVIKHIVSLNFALCCAVSVCAFAACHVTSTLQCKEIWQHFHSDITDEAVRTREQYYADN